MHPIIILIISIVLILTILRRTFPLRLPSTGFVYVYVEEDGSVRELDTEEQLYLQEKFHPNDGDRPYIKSSYWQKTTDNKIDGFLKRIRVPWWITIKPYGT